MYKVSASETGYELVSGSILEQMAHWEHETYQLNLLLLFHHFLHYLVLVWVGNIFYSVYCHRAPVVYLHVSSG